MSKHLVEVGLSVIHGKGDEDTFDSQARLMVAAALAFLLLILEPAYEFAADEVYVTTPALEIPNSWRAAAKLQTALPLCHLRHHRTHRRARPIVQCRSNRPPHGNTAPRPRAWRRNTRHLNSKCRRHSDPSPRRALPADCD